MSDFPLAQLLWWVFASMSVGGALGMITRRSPVASLLFLVLTFFSLAGVYVLLGAQFIAAIQIIVYAGAIMVLFLFVVMLINYRHLPEEKVLSPAWLGGIGVGLAILVLMISLVRTGAYHEPAVDADQKLTTVRESYITAHPSDPNKLVRRTRDRENRNAEAVAMALYTDYLVPFEVASLFLLVAMIGAIVIGKRELTAEEEEATPQYILDRAETEKEVKESMSA